MPIIIANIVEVALFSFENAAPKYLMLRRSLTETLYPDSWQIVTGTIEKGETAVQAALREVTEETGMALLKFWTVPHVNTFYSVRNDALYHTVVFAAQVPPRTDPTLSHEHRAFGWFSVERAKDLCVWPGQITALDIVHRFIVGGKHAAPLSEIPL